MAIFDYEWCDDAEPSSDRVSQYTMARVRIEAGGQAVTSLYDRYLKDNRDHVFVPLAHVAEWMAANWWHLWYEAADVSGEQRPGFLARHDLADAGNGFVLPRVTFVPVGDRTRVRARRWSPMHAPIEFRAECDVMLERDDVEQEFRSLIGDVIQRLKAKRTPFESLESEWRAIESLDQEEREFCQAVAITGLDPFDLDAQTADRIARAWNQMDPAIREDALGAAPERSLDEIKNWSDRCLESAEQGRSGDSWQSIRQAVRRGGANGDLPWQIGYHDARAVRCELGAASGRFDFDDAGRLGIWSGEAESPSRRIHGIVASESPSCVMIRKPKPGKRFLLARALGDYIGRGEPAPAILSSLDTGRQARSRAFAAEFLAPAAWLRNHVSGAESVDGEAVDELAAELDVSSWVVRHQIQNHHIAEIANPVWPSS